MEKVLCFPSEPVSVEIVRLHTNDIVYVIRAEEYIDTDITTCEIEPTKVLALGDTLFIPDWEMYQLSNDSYSLKVYYKDYGRTWFTSIEQAEHFVKSLNNELKLEKMEKYNFNYKGHTYYTYEIINKGEE